jgi:hypothetical protein
MPKRSASQHVPKEMQARFEEITQLTDAFCHKYLNEEYRQLCRELTATLGRKRPSPLVRGKAPVWACGIIHALGMVNFLFDSSQTPHIAHELRNEVVEELIPDLVGENRAELDAPLVRGGRNRGMESKKGRR